MDDARSTLFVTWEGGGNVPPVLGAARRLVDRGHRVRVLTEPCLREPVEAIGAAFVPFTEHFTRTDRGEVLMEDWRATSPPAAMRDSLKRVVLGPAEPTAQAIEQALDAEPADAIVTDWLLPVGIAVGEARRIPTAVLVHCVQMRPAPGRPPMGLAPMRGPLGRLRDAVLGKVAEGLFDGFLPAYNTVRARRGLDPLAHAMDQYDRADRVLVQTSAAFDFPGQPDPDNVAYVGPVLDAPDWAEGAWQSPWPEGDGRPLVVVSLSSTFQNQRDEIQAAMTALGGLDVRGLVTLGPAMVGEAFDVPDNVVAVDRAPHDVVLPHAAAMVTHGGHGSTIRALAHGVPVVVLPMGRDQDATAARVAARGVGLKAKATPAKIAAAVRRVLTEPAFRDAAHTLGQTIRADAEADRVVTEIEALAATRAVRTSVPA
ncbi:glycosyltransferase [Rubrivirga sp. IMCC43871]|uniref:glycosyltransferase n=1 Tax=Rubrivirga sp. IMCC43871 TaxID=3391575 RepID=UPI00398FE7A2